MRNLVETHLSHCSINSVEKALEICERNLYKGDIFSFGCVLYEMMFLKIAFDNKFLLPDEAVAQTTSRINKSRTYSNDLKDLAKLTMTRNPDERLNINRIYQLDLIKSRINRDFSGSYRRQVLPHLKIDSNFAKKNVLECIKVQLDNNYKPATMKTLKFNQNLIVIVANKHMNVQKSRNSSFKVITSTFNNFSPFNAAQAKGIAEEAMSEEEGDYVEEAMLFIYNEYGQLVKEFNSFILNEWSNLREKLDFKVYDFCIDEDHDQMYLSTKQHGK